MDLCALVRMVGNISFFVYECGIKVITFFFVLLFSILSRSGGCSQRDFQSGVASIFPSFFFGGAVKIRKKLAFACINSVIWDVPHDFFSRNSWPWEAFFCPPHRNTDETDTLVRNFTMNWSHGLRYVGMQRTMLRASDGWSIPVSYTHLTLPTKA